MRAVNPVTSYRFLVETPHWGPVGQRRRNVATATSEIATTSSLSTFAAAARLARRCRVLRDLPGSLRPRHRRAGLGRPRGRLGDRVRLGHPDRRRLEARRPPALPRRPRRRAPATRPPRAARCQPAVPHAGVPGSVVSSLRRFDVRRRRPGARRRRRLLGADRRRPPSRHPGDRRPDHQPLRQPPSLVRGGAGRRRPHRRPATTTSPSIPTTTSGGSTCRPCRSSTCARRQLREALLGEPDGIVARWLRRQLADGDDGLDGWRIDVGNMTGRHGPIDVNHDVFRDVRATMAAVRPDVVARSASTSTTPPPTSPATGGTGRWPARGSRGRCGAGWPSRRPACIGVPGRLPADRRRRPRRNDARAHGRRAVALGERAA